MTSAGWNLPSLLPPVAMAVVYVAGVTRHRDTGVAGLRLPRSRVAAFLIGAALLAVAVASPIDHLAARQLSWHMVQHVMLVVCVAPLLAAGMSGIVLASMVGAPARDLLAALRRQHAMRRGSAAVPRLLVSAAVVHAVVLLSWHAPPLYEAALGSDLLHVLEHLMFLGSAWALWALVLRRGRRSRLGRGTAIMCLGGMILVGGVLGALLTFASEPVYPTYVNGTADALTDQQLAGSIMWVPPGIAYGVAVVVLFIGWFRTIDEWMVAREGVASDEPVAGRGTST